VCDKQNVVEIQNRIPRREEHEGIWGQIFLTS